MKKLFLLFAFTGIVGAASANSLISLAKANVITVNGDEKKGDEKKKANKDKKACCKKDGEKKNCAEGKEKKACCASKHAETKPAEKK